jgi:DtxR family transcriptional regulator, Mn-dependent transcriptional regulator
MHALLFQAAAQEVTDAFVASPGILLASGPIDPLLALGWGALVVAGLSCIFWPRRGLLSRWQRSGQLQQRVLAEDALKHIYKTEIAGRRPTLESLAGGMEVNLNRAAEVVADLQQRELLELPGSEMRLSSEGRRYALSIIRAHRLWEQHLAERTGVAESEWHRRAEHQEHFISPEQARRLEAQLGNPLFDPHGDPIPKVENDLVAQPTTSIAAIPVNAAARIVHIEDEPDAVYAQITAAGLYPGMVVRVLENSPQRIRLWTQGEECVLAPVVASNLSVVPLPDALPEAPAAGRTLTELAPGATARVAQLSPRCRGAERRRLMDLGILPGTLICAELASPSGNLTAYRVRGALIALRQEQSDLIQVGSPETASA